LTTDTEASRRSPEASREQRGSEPRRGSTLGHDLSGVPRRYGQWTAAVLIVVFAVLAAGWLWQQRNDRVEVLTLRRDVPAGSVIERSDLAVADVAGLTDAVPADEAETVVGQVAAIPLVAGQVVTVGMATSAPIPGRGQRLVGVELDATRAPNELGPGDQVTVLAVPPTGDASSPVELKTPSVLAETATVVAAEHIEGAGTRLTLLVAKAAADQVAAFGAAGRVALVKAPLGGD
jgi:hypothetical protein